MTDTPLLEAALREVVTPERLEAAFYGSPAFSVSRMLPSKSLTALPWFINGGFVMVDSVDGVASVREWA